MSNEELAEVDKSMGEMFNTYDVPTLKKLSELSQKDIARSSKNMLAATVLYMSVQRELLKRGET